MGIYKCSIVRDSHRQKAVPDKNGYDKAELFLCLCLLISNGEVVVAFFAFGLGKIAFWQKSIVSKKKQHRPTTKCNETTWKIYR